MKRRDFVRGSAAAFGGALLAPHVKARTPIPDPGPLTPLGLQLYTVRADMERDFEGTLARVAEIGYREVEFANYFNRTPSQIRATLERNHLTAPGMHIEYRDLQRDPARTLETTRAVGHEYAVVAWIAEDERRTLDGWRRVADGFNRAARQAQSAGLKLAYHNHSYEFEPLGGRLPYDVLLENTDPELVKLEMDLYWITQGGQDPLTYFARYPGRITLVHLKDMTTDRRMVDVGAGAIDWPRILRQRQQAGIRHYFVEHDEPADAFASITASYRYLSRLDV